jgi:hypothetical protein
MRFIKRKLFGSRIRYSFSLGRPSSLKALPVFLIAVLIVFFLIASPVLAADSDNDGVDDSIDNCPFTANPSQTDTNGDGLGDACDTDHDGIHNSIDNCQGTVSTDIRDSDADGFGNPCDNCKLIANNDQTDSDGDDIGDACDPDLVAPPCGPIEGNSSGEREPDELYNKIVAWHVYTLRIPPDQNNPIGDTLPAGSGFVFRFPVFDTGADQVVFGSSVDGGPSRMNYTGNPALLDIRIWGLQAIGPEVNGGIPGNNPEFEFHNVNLNEQPDLPTLLGGPVPNQVVAYIDYTITVTRSFTNGSTETVKGPAITFFDPSDPSIPEPLFSANVELIGSTIPSSPTTIGKGPRPLLRNTRFVNTTDGTTHSVESPASPTTIPSGKKFLIDTGNSTTQIGQNLAEALGIDYENAVPVDTITIGGKTLKGFKIDRFEIHAANGSDKYEINEPLVFVWPEPTRFGVDANIGGNFFEQTQLLVDLPGSQIGLFRGVCNQPPECDANGPYVSECAGTTTSVQLDGSGSTDPDGDPLTYLWTSSFGSATGANPTMQFPELGTFTIDLVVDDGRGGTAACSAEVTVEDTTPPSLTVPPDITKECEGPAGTAVDIGVATASDICDESIVVQNDAPDPTIFLLGTTDVTWTATDSSGNSSTATQTVTVVDTTPPTLELSVTPDVLWPPNHKMVPIMVTAEAIDVCDSEPIVELFEITMNEGDETISFDEIFDSTVGDGHTVGDIQVGSNGEVSLRAERSGKGDGRIYTITYIATDGSGNSTTASATVTVPHNR